MSDKNITIGNDTRPMTAEEATKWEEDIAKESVLNQEAQDAKVANDNLKASAKAKLIAGEALTEAEADTIVI